MRPRVVILIVTVVVLFVVGWLEIRRGSQYKVGMSITQVQQLTSKMYPIHQLALSYSTPPSQQELTREPVLYINDTDAGVILYFNHYQVLISKTRTKILGVDVYKLADVFR